MSVNSGASLPGFEKFISQSSLGNLFNLTASIQNIIYDFIGTVTITVFISKILKTKW